MSRWEIKVCLGQSPLPGALCLTNRERKSQGIPKGQNKQMHATGREDPKSEPDIVKMNVGVIKSGI